MSKKKTAPAQPSLFARIRYFLQSERTQKISGFFFLLIGLYLLVAFTSYLFTWQTDQDKVFQFSWQLLFMGEVNVDNKLGRLGAILSHNFFYNWFGIASFLFIPLIVLTGWALIKGKISFNLRKLTLHLLFLIFWLSVTSGFLFATNGFPWGGKFGLTAAGWLTDFAGVIGAAAMLLFVAGAFLIWNFNLSVLGFFQKEKDIAFAGEAEAGQPPEITDETSVIEEETEPAAGEIDLSIETNEQEEHQEQEESPEEEENISLDIEETEEEKLADENAPVVNYDPTLDLSSYKYPTLDLLEEYNNDKITIDKNELEKNKDQIIATLNNYNIDISKIKATVGPTVTLYEIIPSPGVRISKIKNLEDDIALSLAALGIRIIAPIPGKGTIGIEVPNQNKEIVPLRSLLASEKFQQAKMDLPIALGKTIANEIYITDLAKMPHLLMAGATGQGKSVGLNSILASLLYKKHPSQLKFVLIDPKKVELTLFKLIENHFLAKLPGEQESIITDTQKVIHTLKALCKEMDQRYDLLKNAHVRNIKEYNQKFVNRKLNPEKGHRFLPFIVLVIDEFADLIMTAGKEVEMPIARLAQLARAVGVHLVIATQRPSVNIITGTIKANFPGRIAFKVTSKIDSRTILDAGGADQLIGRGDMLLSVNGDIVRLQCPFIDTPEVENLTEFIGDQQGYPEPFLLPEVADENSDDPGAVDLADKDDMFEDAARVVVQNQQGSTSLIQRRLKLGYNRAGRIMDQLEAAGIVGPSEGSKAREVLIADEYQLEQFLNDLDKNA